jgi:hypothetical protein
MGATEIPPKLTLNQVAPFETSKVMVTEAEFVVPMPPKTEFCSQVVEAKAFL